MEKKLQSEIDSLRIINEYGVFQPKFTCDSWQMITDKQGNLDIEYTNYIETMSAKDVYQKYLIDKENPPTPVPTEAEKIGKYMLDLDYRLSLQELGGK